MVPLFVFRWAAIVFVMVWVPQFVYMLHHSMWCYCYRLHAWIWKSIDPLSPGGERAVANDIEVFHDIKATT